MACERVAKGLPASRFHRRIVMSAPPLATNRASGRAIVARAVTPRSAMVLIKTQPEDLQA